mgnify:CR=1 FL=1
MPLLQRESDKKIRCFTAVPVPDGIKEELARFQKELGPLAPGAKWVKPAGLHITLKFLGEISPEKVEEVRAALRDAVRAARFNMAFSGLGVFPNPRKARVPWTGFETGAGECTGIAAEIEDALEAIGFPREKRPFRAHLTLARLKKPSSVGNDLLDYEFSSSGFSAQSVVLYRSTLKPSGAVYTPIESFPLR